MARALGRELDVPVDLVRYDSAGSVVAAADKQEWDVAFLAIDPARGELFHFTLPYLVIATTYVVPAASPVTTSADADKNGTLIASAKGAAYDLYLRRILKHAKIVPAQTPADALDLLVNGGADCAAGVRQTLEAFVAREAGYRVLPDNLVTVDHAVVTHRGRAAGAAFLDGFVMRQIGASGG
jgi:polar amino acid transport system substrate-binding protein